MRLFYHPESDSLFLEEPGDWQNTADGALSHDVSDEPEFRSRAVLDDIDLSSITPEDDFWAMPLEAVKPVKSSGGVSGAIAASMAKWARKPADLYPTPVDCTYSLLPHIAPLLPPNALVLEPCCGDGKMVEPLREFGYEVDGTDLRPEVTGGRGGLDYLDDTNYFPGDHYDAVITNPPFSIAAEFIQRSLQIAPVVAMLLKAQYWNTKNRKKLFRETKPFLELNLTWRPAFLEEERGKSPLMDCAWWIWVRGNEDECRVRLLDRLLSCPVNVGAMDMGGL